MKKFSIVASLAAIMIICTALPAAAQFRFGLRVGTNVSELHFNSKTFDSSNRMGFNAGAMVEFSAPMTGIGFDASVMYVRRNSRWAAKYDDGTTGNISDNRDYIDIPLNLKWRMSIPLINKIVRPFLTTGPSFSFLTSRKSVSEAWNNRKFDTAWNFGFGLELLQKVQVSASYGLGLTKALNTVGATSTANIEGKNRYWTVTAAYMF